MKHISSIALYLAHFLTWRIKIYLREWKNISILCSRRVKTLPLKIMIQCIVCTTRRYRWLFKPQLMYSCQFIHCVDRHVISKSANFFLQRIIKLTTVFEWRYNGLDSDHSQWFVCSTDIIFRVFQNTVHLDCFILKCACCMLKYLFRPIILSG